MTKIASANVNNGACAELIPCVKPPKDIRHNRCVLYTSVHELNVGKPLPPPHHPTPGI